jgi:hypothetical protein
MPTIDLDNVFAFQTFKTCAVARVHACLLRARVQTSLRVQGQSPAPIPWHIASPVHPSNFRVHHRCLNRPGSLLASESHTQRALTRVDCAGFTIIHQHRYMVRSTPQGTVELTIAPPGRWDNTQRTRVTHTVRRQKNLSPAGATPSTRTSSRTTCRGKLTAPPSSRQLRAIRRGVSAQTEWSSRQWR